MKISGREAKQFIRDIKRQISNGRIVATGLEILPISWQIGNKIYEAGKIRVFLEAIWQRIRILENLEKVLVSEREKSILMKTLVDVVTILRAVKREPKQTEKTSPSGLEMFTKLSDACALFLKIYFGSLADILKVNGIGYKQPRFERDRFMKRILFVLWLLSFCGFSSAVSATAQRDIPAVPDMESSWFVNLDRFANSAHGTFPCEQCHTDLDKGDTLHPVSESAASLMKSATRLYDYSRCRTCHRTSYEKYLLGEHARALQKEKLKPGNKDLSGAASGNAPTCGDCHSSHYVKSHLSRLETGRSMTEVCGSCHPAQKASYLENYHGKAAVNLGNDKAAFCTDCHGAHQCISLKDKKAALTACQRCHPEAGTALRSL